MRGCKGFRNVRGARNASWRTKSFCQAARYFLSWLENNSKPGLKALAAKSAIKAYTKPSKAVLGPS